MRKLSFTLLLLITFISCTREFEFKSGDLLFQDIDCGPLCDAIENVTSGYEGRKISHVGIVNVTDSGTYVIEAYGTVRLTELKEFMQRSIDRAGNPKIIVGRLQPRYTKYLAESVNRAIKLVGCPYDDDFLLNNGKYYCSELVYETYLDDEGNHLFNLRPMTWKNPLTGEYDSTWVEYFSDKNQPIPEGKPGCNPADYSRSPKLSIVKVFY
ncbi:YiiX/YebB-like N1pC/P60 family cysteine hydrolase [Tenuifilum thalassicum]|uniref:Permuted papain-like amidase enzyme, YaeF/YiiX, C92 family n=1 Tax=Tenuifilum thalassicum TaxID=2590900 RepID=A0A7D4BYS0_9BACT|nr:YiiX/YebB-like N1pC/P60 family cysteine hydrolase [Tenuifilum thalassicum]QKG79264.1 hypothetical protein FHG85_02955 [Tenuifilum thalassicum]